MSSCLFSICYTSEHHVCPARVAAVPVFDGVEKLKVDPLLGGAVVAPKPPKAPAEIRKESQSIWGKNDVINEVMELEC